MRYDNAENFKKETGHEVNGAWYPRVTKILEIKSKPALQAFFKEVGSFAAAEDIKNKSAEEGTLIHATIQGVLSGRPTEIPDSVKASVLAVLKFNEQKKMNLHEGFIERPVWSARHRYSGTVDALATIDGKFGVLDIKTSTGFYPEYNLQTSAYVSALQEFEIKKLFGLTKSPETRWILRVDQQKKCQTCGSTLREKGGRLKIRSNWKSSGPKCFKDNHQWGEMAGEVELREFPYIYKDFRAFVAAKILWEWENDYWLKQIGYLK